MIKASQISRKAITESTKNLNLTFLLMVIKAPIIKVLFAEMYVNVVFVIRRLYSAVSLTLVREQRFIILLLLLLLRLSLYTEIHIYY